MHAADVVDDTLTVTGKGGKVRDVPIEHAELRLRLRGLSGWAFPSTNRARGPITAAHVSKLLARVLPGGWTAHTLRHRMGTRAYAGSRDLLAVSALLGHSRPETTRRYVQLPDDAIRAAAAAAAS